MSFFLILIHGTLKKLNMAKFKDYLLTKQEVEEKTKIEEAEQNYKPTGIGVTVKGWADELDRQIKQSTTDWAEEKWGVCLSEWDEEPQD